METIKGKRTVEIEVTTYKFEASSGDYHESLTIVDGEIQETGCWDSRNGGGRRKGESGFAESCYSTIRFIVNHKPEKYLQRFGRRCNERFLQGIATGEIGRI